MDYTVDELKVFADALSIKLLALRSAQYWKTDEETADRIMWLEALYGKVNEDIKKKEFT